MARRDALDIGVIVAIIVAGVWAAISISLWLLSATRGLEVPPFAIYVLLAIGVGAGTAVFDTYFIRRSVRRALRPKVVVPDNLILELKDLGARARQIYMPNSGHATSLNSAVAHIYPQLQKFSQTQPGSSPAQQAIGILSGTTTGRRTTSRHVALARADWLLDNFASYNLQAFIAAKELIGTFIEDSSNDADYYATVAAGTIPTPVPRDVKDSWETFADAANRLKEDLEKFERRAQAQIGGIASSSPVIVRKL